MAMTKAELQKSAQRYRLPSEIVGVALLAVGVFVSLGVAARRRIEPVRAELTKLTAATAEVSEFRGAFRTSTPAQDARVQNLPDSFAIALSRDQRVSLAEQIAARAERAGLSDVRVKFALPDSAATPERPDLLRTSVGVADYTLSVECTGGFAAVLSLVNHLPPSVALQRVVGARMKGGGQYRLILAVFEVAGSIQHG
jgi:hypothetical protein